MNEKFENWNWEKALANSQNETTTRDFLIHPFLDLLNYDRIDDYTHEVTADLGKKKGKKVDVAITLGGKNPVILIECKKSTAKLNDNHYRQLREYCTDTNTAKIGILTNGIVYKFYTRNNTSTLQTSPFFEFDLSDYDNQDLETLSLFMRNVIDINSILEAADIRSKMLFLCSPNNPTGNSFSMERVEELLQRFNGLVVIDEAYIDFSDAKSWLEKLKNYPNLVITQTLSKAYGLAGIRLGICYASKEIIEILNTIKPPYNVNELSQQKAIERLLQPDEVTQEILKIKEERANLVSNLKTINYVQEIYPSACNFVLVKVDNATKRYDQLIAKGIVIRNRTTQPLCENCLRLTVGTRLENSRLIHVLKEI